MADPIDEDLRAVKPEGEDIAKQKARAKLSAALFGAPSDPVKLGRFVILDRLGQGGMGVVYSAYDPELDRRVALKLLRTDAGEGSQRAQMRLKREAQALARLTHPNVVTVHEVGVLENQVFIVMELVRGKSLRQWAKSADEHSVSEILGVYLQAGEGLAAAHDLGLVHRDFKPDNALIGEDGRVRVVDFGLVTGREASADASETSYDGISRDGSSRSERASSQSTRPASQNLPTDAAMFELGETQLADTAVPTPSHGSGGLSTPLTATGAIMGTPAYMSPEQFTSAHVGPKSDQFSFCVALYEALCGQRPFAGENAAELIAAVRKGQIREVPKGSRVPGWVVTILRRGLAAKPDDRYPSMHELLVALRRDPRRVLRRRLAALLAVAASAGVIYALTRPAPTAADLCRTGDRLQGLWDEDRKEAIETAILGTNQPYAPEGLPLVVSGLDAYAAEWVAMDEDACLAHQRGLQSTVFFDKRTACLERRRNALVSAVNVLTETTAESVTKVVDVVENLPRIDYCANVDALMAEVPLPEDPVLARQVAELRQLLGRAKALIDAGRYSDALDVVSTVLPKAGVAGYQPLMAESLLLQGRVYLGMRDRLKAIEPFYKAAVTGLRVGMHELVVEAFARQIFAQATTRGKSDDLTAYLAVAEALAENIPHSVFAHALLLNNAGTMYLAAGDRDTARGYFERAMALREKERGEADIELSVITSNLALVTDNPKHREVLLRSTHYEYERRLGPSHPETITRLHQYAYFMLNPIEALKLTASACAALGRYYSLGNELRLECLMRQGFLEAQFGSIETAIKQFAEIEELPPQPSAYGALEAECARGYGYFYRGDHEKALAIFDGVEKALSAEVYRTEHWGKRLLATIHLGKGASVQALGKHEQAISLLGNALSLYEEITLIYKDVEIYQRIAWVRWLLANALSDAAGKPSASPVIAELQRRRALALVGQVEDWYQQAGPGYEQKLAEIAAWRSAHQQ